MTKTEKTQVIEELVSTLSGATHFYLTDVSKLTAEDTSKLRRKFFEKKIKMMVVKNTLLEKAMEKSTDRDYSEFIGAPMKGNTALLISEVGNAPAKIIQEFRKTKERPLLKGAFVEQGIYIGDNQLNVLAAIKSKNELIGDIIGLLQSPVRNVVGGLTNPDRKFKNEDAAPEA